jgi:hypothetical protein
MTLDDRGKEAALNNFPSLEVAVLTKHSGSVPAWRSGNVHSFDSTSMVSFVIFLWQQVFWVSHTTIIVLASPDHYISIQDQSSANITNLRFRNMRTGEVIQKYVQDFAPTIYAQLLQVKFPSAAQAQGPWRQHVLDEL